MQYVNAQYQSKRLLSWSVIIFNSKGPQRAKTQTLEIITWELWFWGVNYAFWELQAPWPKPIREPKGLKGDSLSMSNTTNVPT